MGNFDFIKSINKNFYELGETAEKLFRDEYYDQCITQTRKMAEVMTKTILGCKAQEGDTFDDMLYKLKTISCDTKYEQEFIRDMYFLKKQGNIATHSEKSGNDGEIALECLEHAFEACVNYAYSKTKDDNINRLLFDEKLLVLGEKNNSLQQRYKQELENEKQRINDQNGYINSFEKKQKKQKKAKKQNKKYNKKEKINDKKTNIFGKILQITIIISFVILSVLILMSKIKTPEPTTKNAPIENQSAKEVKKQKNTSNLIKIEKESQIEPQTRKKTHPVKNSTMTKDDLSITKNFSI